MKTIIPRVELQPLSNPGRDAILNIERIARTCYKSEDKIKTGSAEKMVRSLIKNGHHAMLEHGGFCAKFTVDRGVSHEIVRHRLSSFAQESTRYCNYGDTPDGITFIEPIIFKDEPSIEDKDAIADGKVMFLDDSVYPDPLALYSAWYWAMMDAENSYDHMIAFGATPEFARSVLPNSVKTEIWMTADFREWRHFFELRALGKTGTPHPEIKRVALPLLVLAHIMYPIIFEDLYEAACDGVIIHGDPKTDLMNITHHYNVEAITEGIK